MLYFSLTVCTGAGVVMMGGVCTNCSENTFAGVGDANCTGFALKEVPQMVQQDQFPLMTVVSKWVWKMLMGIPLKLNWEKKPLEGNKNRIDIKYKI